LARGLSQRGVEVLGFLGRSPQNVAAAILFAGAGRALAVTDLRAAHAVVFAVGDGDLAAAVQQCAAAPPRRCSLWLHTSGRFGLDVLAPLVGTGARLGSLHPVLPFSSAAAGFRALAGAPAVLQGEPRSRRLLSALAVRLGMVPLWAEAGDRTLYHAACVLAASGVTALRALVDQLLQQSSGLPAGGAAVVVDSLMRAALAGAAALGPAAALSGPLARGDAATVAAHLAALAARAPAAVPAYRAVLQAALPLAAQRGLSAEQLAALARVLAGGG
jgi:predicted short-subunit dehydrogenase-like oxidoreductase (DUF2520 family)